jgi:hypothetical protein
VTLRDAESGTPLVAGDVHAVRTYRVGPDGTLYSVTRPEAWSEDWHRATCGQGHAHTAPDADCSCGNYAFSHADYARERPESRSCLAVVAGTGEIMQGSRGVRMAATRIEAVWLGPAVSDALYNRIADRYAGVALHRDKAAMLAEFPPSEIEGFRAPRFGPRARRAGYTAIAAVAAGMLAFGQVPIGTVAQHWVLLGVFFAVMGLLAGAVIGSLVGVLRNHAAAPFVALGGGFIGTWLVNAPLGGHSTFSPTGLGFHVLLLVCAGYCGWMWRRAGQPGRPVNADRAVLIPTWARRLAGKSETPRS